LNSQQLKLENTTISESQSPLKLVPEVRGLTLTDTNRLGDIAEYVVITEALKRGAEVYKNVGCTGKTDIVLCNCGEVLHVDVKTEEWDPRSNKYYSPGKAGAVEHRVLVNPETWKVRWPFGKAPEGWEMFWY
jgi:hypothetical protein